MHNGKFFFYQPHHLISAHHSALQPSPSSSTSQCSQPSRATHHDRRREKKSLLGDWPKQNNLESTKQQIGAVVSSAWLPHRCSRKYFKRTPSARMAQHGNWTEGVRGGGVDYFEIESQNVEREPLKPGNMSYNLPRAINDWWKLSGSRRNHKAQDTYDSIIHISFTHSGTPPGVPPACFSLISHSTQCFYAFICKYINFSIIFCLILFLFYSHISLEPPTLNRTAKSPIRAQHRTTFIRRFSLFFKC